MKLSTLFFITFSVISMGANAHGSTPKKADKSIIINAPIDEVWAVIKHFDNEEGLDYFSNADHEYNYRLKTENTDVFPVSSCTTAIQLMAEDDKTKVK